MGRQGVKVLGRVVDDLLDLSLAQAPAGFHLNVVGHRFKSHLGRLDRDPFLQPMRVATGRQMQLGIAGKEAADPALAIARAGYLNGTKDAFIACFHMIALVRTHHAIAATHDVFKPRGAWVIQMILPQQPEQFAPIGLEVGLNCTVSLVTRHLGAQMRRDLDKLFMENGSMENGDRIIFGV